MAAKLDVEYCDALVERVSAGDRPAQEELLVYLWPQWIDFVRTSRSMGPLARSEDHVHNVVTKLVAKLSDPSGAHLEQYLAWRRREVDKTFEDWTRIVVANQVRDYAREILGPASSQADEPSPKRLLNEFMAVAPKGEPSVRPPYTANETARELLELAETRLPADQLQALRAWLEGASYEDLELQLGLPRGHGKRLVRAAVAVLRRYFADGEVECDLLT